MTDEVRREVHGYVVWGICALVVAVPEVTAALKRQLPGNIGWPTISSTTGHLEYFHSWVALIVVAVIVFVAFEVLTYPPARLNFSGLRATPARTFCGRLTRRPEALAPWPMGVTYAYLGAAAALVGLGSWLASDRSDAPYVTAYVLYGGIALFVVVVPSVFAFAWAKDAAYPTFFRTLADLERRCHLVAALVVVLLVILLVHLALYPWPGVSHVLNPHPPNPDSP